MQHEVRLFTSRALQLPKAGLELPGCGLYNEKDIIDVWPWVVLALMPAVGTLRQGFVVAFLVLLDEALQADVSAYLEP